MPGEFQYDVFLSHSSKDKAVVRDIAERLRNDGLKVWLVPAVRLREVGFDEWVNKPGDSFPAKIEEGLKCSRVLACPAIAMGATRTSRCQVPRRGRMLYMSANAFGSDWAQLESGTFRFRDPLKKERRLVPLRLDAAASSGGFTVDWKILSVE